MPLSRYDNFRTIIHEETSDSRLETFPSVTAEELKDDSDILITLNDSQRLDTVALKYLGDGRLWWVICLLNDFVFPFGNDLVSGTVIRVPSNIDRVYQVINRNVK